MKPRMMSESRQSAPISSRLGTLRGAPRGGSGDPGSAMEEWTVGSGPARLPLPPQPPRPRAPWPRARRRRVPHGAGSPPSPSPRRPAPPSPALAPRRALARSSPARPRRQRPLSPGGEPDTRTRVGSGVYRRTGDQDPATFAPNRLPCPKTPEPYQEGPGPCQAFCHQVRLLEASADKGLLSSFTLFRPRRLGVRASENIQADDLVFPILPSSKAPMPRTVLRNSIPSEALAGDGITTSGQGSVTGRGRVA